MKPFKDNMDKFRYELFPVKFETAEGAIEVPERVDIQVVHPREVIEMEMSKREKKKYFGGS